MFRSPENVGKFTDTTPALTPLLHWVERWLLLPSAQVASTQASKVGAQPSLLHTQEAINRNQIIQVARDFTHFSTESLTYSQCHRKQNSWSSTIQQNLQESTADWHNPSHPAARGWGLWVAKVGITAGPTCGESGRTRWQRSRWTCDTSLSTDTSGKHLQTQKSMQNTS